MISVLVVDDEENARSGLVKLLRCSGFRVSEAINGRDALSSLAEEQVDLVITDVNMPEMNGLVFLQELNKYHPQIKVVMITAYAGLRHYLEAMNLGAMGYLNKPFRIEELKAIICKTVDPSRTRRYPYADSEAVS